MKQTLFLLVLIVHTTSTNAQSNRETEDWLRFYLNHFNSRATNIINGRGYIDSYSFKGDSLVISQYNELGDSASWKLIYVDLRKIIKIEIATDSADDFLPCYRIWLYFKELAYPNECPGATMREARGGKPLPSSWIDTYELDFRDWQILEDNMPQRIQKALSHLVALHGGTIIKEVF